MGYQIGYIASLKISAFLALGLFSIMACHSRDFTILTSQNQFSQVKQVRHVNSNKVFLFLPTFRAVDS